MFTELRSRQQSRAHCGITAAWSVSRVDGKRDRHTKVVVEEVYNGEVITKQKNQVEEHQTYTVEPAGPYLTHSAIPKDKGTGRDLAEDFLDVFCEYDSKESILAVLCDSTATNTGWKQ